MIAEYERAKIAERYRRGKLFRSRAGEVLAWRTPYGYRRLPRDAAGPGRLERLEPEAEVVRRIFKDTVAGGHSTRSIARRLAADQVPTPTGRSRVWGTSTIGRLLRNEAYVGRVYFNRTESVPDPRPGHKNKHASRPQEEWIAITVPAIVTDEVFAAAARVSQDNSKWSPRRAEPGQWLLKGLDRCRVCGVGTNCNKMRGRNDTWHRYYYCRNHDPIRAGGQDRRCPERNIRSDALDAYVFDQVRATLQRPDTLLRGAQAIAASTPTPDDELLGVELARHHPCPAKTVCFPWWSPAGSPTGCASPGHTRRTQKQELNNRKGWGLLVATSGDFNLAIDTSGANALVDQRL